MRKAALTATLAAATLAGLLSTGCDDGQPADWPTRVGPTEPAPTVDRFAEVIPGEYELCRMTLGDGTEVGTLSTPCADPTVSENGIRILYADGRMSEEIQSAKLHPDAEHTFSHVATETTIWYTVYR